MGKGKLAEKLKMNEVSRKVGEKEGLAEISFVIYMRQRREPRDGVTGCPIFFGKSILVLYY